MVSTWCPAETVLPATALMPPTVPSLCACSGCSIFIASRTTTRSPLTTCCPSSTATLTTVACIGDFTASPAAPALAVVAWLRRDGGTAAGRPAVPAATATRSGRLTSRRFPPTSTTTVWRPPEAPGDSSSPSHAGMSLSNSVSIQRVKMPKFPSSAVNAGSRTTLRWNGSTVGRPATSNSSSARRERSRASSRLLPVTMIFASSESNAPDTESPAVTPESRRIPGPPKVLNTCTGPGWGRKPRPGSSPLMRNSNECP